MIYTINNYITGTNDILSSNELRIANTQTQSSDLVDVGHWDKYFTANVSVGSIVTGNSIPRNTTIVSISNNTIKLSSSTTSPLTANDKIVIGSSLAYANLTNVLGTVTITPTNTSPEQQRRNNFDLWMDHEHSPEVRHTRIEHLEDGGVMRHVSNLETDKPDSTYHVFHLSNSMVFTANSVSEVHDLIETFNEEHYQDLYGIEYTYDTLEEYTSVLKPKKFKQPKTEGMQSI